MKKVISVILVLLMTFGTCAYSLVFAADNIIDIDEAYSNVSTYYSKITDKQISQFLKECKAYYYKNKSLGKISFTPEYFTPLFSVNKDGYDLYRNDYKAFLSELGIKNDTGFYITEYYFDKANNKYEFFYEIDFTALGIPFEYWNENTAFISMYEFALMYHTWKKVEANNTIGFKMTPGDIHLMGSAASDNANDINFDCRFTSLDILSLKQYIAGGVKHVNFAAADRDGNGRITAIDISLLKASLK